MKRIKKVGIALCWLLLWEIASLIVHNKILLAGPIEAFRALVGMAGSADFGTSVLSSVFHIVSGIVLGGITGILLGSLSLKFKLLGEFLSPVVTALKSVPVASFVVLILIWIGSDSLSTVIVTLVVFPIIYLATVGGFTAADNELLEMAHVYRMPTAAKIRYIYIPALIPSYLGAFSVAVGMGFKSGVAAEVIGQPLLTMGNGLYRSKINLDTAEVFAWTFTIILASWVTEKMFSFLIYLCKMLFMPGASNDAGTNAEEA
ncbi:ABC transporter permease [Butyrivibrio sp. JL13D10]|uniref:ABC transporter permease n=1 Tax=Butyrivibrio sp. JL13D10 TaxID=3236815 RepID=UPI0038B68F28